MTLKEKMIRDHPRATPLYRDLIQSACKCADEEVGAVESLMRDLYHTLDHLDRVRFVSEAKIAYLTLNAMASEEA